MVSNVEALTSSTTGPRGESDVDQGTRLPTAGRVASRIFTAAVALVCGPLHSTAGRVVSDRRRHGEHVEGLTSSTTGPRGESCHLVRVDRQPAAW
jgi:hypothetical protein